MTGPKTAACLAALLLLAGCATTPVSELDVLQRRFPLGATQQQLASSVSTFCADAVVHEYTPAEAAPYAQQTQIDCLGYEFTGKPRKLELLINEGRLGFYWLMLDDFEVARTSVQDQLGEPTCASGDYVIYENQSVAIRRDPIEILVSKPRDFRQITGGCA